MGISVFKQGSDTQEITVGHYFTGGICCRVVFAFPYIAERLGDLGTEGSSSYYRIIGPLAMVGYSLANIDGVVRFGSLYEYVRIIRNL